MSENKTPITQFKEWLASKSIDPKLLTTDEAEKLAEEFGKTKTIPNPKNKSKKTAKEMFIQAFFKTIYNISEPAWHELTKDVYETGKFISSAWTEFLFSSGALMIPSDPQHKKHVEKAIDKGIQIHPKVLKDYPDLKSKAKTPKKKPATVKIGDEEYDCEELAERERKQLSNRRKSTAKRNKKSESSKNVEKVKDTTKKVEESLDERIDQGKTVSVSEVETMIGSTKGLIRKLEGLLKKAS